MQRRVTDVGSARRFYRDTLAAGARESWPLHQRRMIWAALGLGALLILVGLATMRTLAYAGIGILAMGLLLLARSRMGRGFGLLASPRHGLGSGVPLPFAFAWESEDERRAAGMDLLVPVGFHCGRRPFVEIIASGLDLRGFDLKVDGDELVASRDDRDVARMTLLAT